jgi:uncharacterized protein DUF3891
MILQERGDQLVMIRQTDHAVLSGFLAREWGNDLFQRPEPFDSFLLAVTEHDNGWREWELAPELDAKTRLPYSFMSLPTEQHISLYQRGIERLIKKDRYAGLLVSMHCQELYDRTRATIPGFSAKYVKASETELVNSFVQSLKLQQLRLKVDLRADLAMRSYAEEKTIETNFRLLEVLDRLSLHFCLDPSQPSTIENVPVDGRGSEIDFEIRPESDNVVSLTPYPFRKEPLQVSILTRQVLKRFYTDNAQFQKTLAQAPYTAMNFVLRSGNALSASRFAVA